MSEQPGRYQRSTSGMVGALLVTLLAILAFVGLRACTRNDLDVQPQHVDYRAEIGFAQRSGAELAYPGTLPSGWYATQVDFQPGRRPDFGLSLLTATGAYAGLRQSGASTAELLTTYVDEHPTASSPVTLGGPLATRWDTWTDSGGDTALTARWHHQSLMVFGSAPLADLELLARSLTARPVATS